MTRIERPVRALPTELPTSSAAPRPLTSAIVPDLAPSNPAGTVAVKSPYAPDPVREKKIDALLAKMSLDDKVMQLVMIPWDGNLTGPDPGHHDGSSIDQLRRGVGWVLNPNRTIDALTIRKVSAEQSRHGIPASISYDVIAGDYTQGPQLLGTACSGDPEMARLQGRVSAAEARARNIDLTFAPNVDWSPGTPAYGRAIESFGSAPFLLRQMATGNLKGFHDGKLATCAKHFAGYGQPHTLVDYGGAVLSKTLLDRTLRPFKEMVAAGTDCIMAAFNTINGIPAHAHKELFRVLRAWGFDGVVISDWTGIAELIHHGVAVDRKAAARLAIEAGVDVDMSSGIYRDHLAALVREGAVPESLVDASVRRVLRYKLRRGLFDEKLGNPNAGEELKKILGPEHRAAVRTVAERSLVLLKNDDFNGKPALPLEGAMRKVAVVGAIADNAVAYLGHWRGRAEINGPDNEGKPTNHDHIITTRKAFTQRFGSAVAYAQGNQVLKRGSEDMWNAVRRAADGSDVVVMVIGESAAMTGEAASVTNDAIRVQEHDIALAKELYESGHKVVVFNVSGRAKPGMQELAKYCHALVQGFQPGTEGGNAFLNLVTGKRADGSAVNFTGKLSVELPRESLDALSIHHERESTGRPSNVKNADPKYTYGPAIYDADGNQVIPSPLHTDHRAAFPFGFGLSYSKLSYSGLEAPAQVTKRQLWDNGYTFSVTLKNDSDRDAIEYAQAYLQRPFASQNQPESRLVASAIVPLKAGETKTVTMHIPDEEFEHFSEVDQRRVLEAGSVTLGVGASSDPASWQTQTIAITDESAGGRPWEVRAKTHTK